MTALYTAMAGRRGRKALRLLAAGCLAGLLSGCYQSQNGHQAYATDYRERHPITLKEGERRVEIFLGRNRGGLNPSQRADVLSFAQLWKREATSGIVIEVPKGGPTDHAAADSMREVHSILAASGVPGRAVYVRNYRPSATAMVSIKINYTKMVAEAGPCGKWPHNLGPGQDATYQNNQPYWNLGCAYQRNMAAMIDNPADLVQPRGEQPAYSARRSIAIDNYRKGINPSGAYSGQYETNKISDLGK
ncbi:MAG: CpaD family pilus assembly protein [Pseudolabrys sp.]|nr:CpaD family pilus assembly protein [Pseudolabrys sp.]MDP2298350.1 CpaD family pilus assembly protein [Pseudolabrys sp.]